MNRCIASLILLLASCLPAAAEGVTPFAEALIWHASAETSSIWASDLNLADTFGATNVEFGWSPGIRAGIDLAPPEWQWDVEVSATHFSTSQESSIPSGFNLVIPEFFSGFVSGYSTDFFGADVDWSIKYTSFDFEAGHDIEMGCNWLVRPQFGLKAAVINQDVTSHWTGLFSLITATERVRHEFFGIGPTAGVAVRWNPGGGSLGLVGEVNGAMLYGTWNVTDDFQRTDGGTPGSGYEAFTTSMKDSQLGTVMLQSFFGMQWKLPCQLDVVAEVGYETQWWANQQRMLTFQQLSMHGDLTFQGGVCGIAVSY
ncbi:Lpg1974 family pore-forming outer membrane protein [Bremerella sp. JC817]|uniref:Lpg1974 family pore-forming outer membrane protein n=1 Tax=Bremerella sp. JC817 TaxID=3231756 RepID=UPI00345A2968